MWHCLLLHASLCNMCYHQDAPSACRLSVFRLHFTVTSGHPKAVPLAPLLLLIDEPLLGIVTHCWLAGHSASASCLGQTRAAVSMTPYLLCFAQQCYSQQRPPSWCSCERALQQLSLAATVKCTPAPDFCDGVDGVPW